MSPSNANVEDAIKSFLAEDIGYGDITTDAIIDPRLRAEAVVTCKEEAVIAGLDEALILLRLSECKGTVLVQVGEKVRAGTRILLATGPARQLLRIERTLLNIISHMSGIATATAELVRIARGSKSRVRIAATRKTLPGLRYFEKRAVELGGGDTHRLGLDDAVLIKDNHLAITRSLADSVRKARSQASFTRKIEVEITKPAQAVLAVRAGADIVLLDNMSPDEIRETVSLLAKRNLRGKVMLEASGGIRKENLSSYARTGVDVISVGAITHSSKSIDTSMEISPARRKR
ncbi:MAG TPA: carboxylating nicotinate-nucleotide diphosphorylase [Candidatus Bathyarchaeia archaeon]|nr:carboxylating nicotinate-nucleotide diphosphorylase [Candidatus Bathyarchaeia archaeon]